MGSYPDVSLAEAREKAAEARKLVKSGVSPVQAKREARRAEAAKPTFGQCADDFLAAKGAEWRNAKHCSQWAMTLREYCAPFRGVPVDQIDTEAVLSVLTPLWSKVPETAARLRGRIEAILDAARARGFIPRNEANPARWRGHLERLLPKRQKLTRGHHAAMPYADVPAFIARLRERKGSAAQALEFCVLTAARSGEVLGARWDEIDVVTRVWTIPAKRMKPGREHRVPLSARAMELLEGLAEARTGEYVFPGRRSGRTLNETAMQQLLGRMGVDDATIHGFRSSFRDWAGHETAFSREVCEQALSHRLGDSAELAYRRGDFLEKRRILMEQWASFCEPTPRENVVAFRKSGVA